MEDVGIKEAIRRKGLEIGFDVIGFAPTVLGEKDKARFRDFLRLRQYGDMEWMARNREKREEPGLLWPPVKSIVVAGLNYAPREFGETKGCGSVSCYAGNRDYHKIVKKRLKKLARWMQNEYTCQTRIFTDTAPLLEKAIAARSGIGWQGKSTGLISREFGAWLFLGEVLTDLYIEPDTGEKNRCVGCAKCVEACPTGALKPYELDATRCISYLTIEHKEEHYFRKEIGNRIYGCDICLRVCPWNRFAKPTKEEAFFPRRDLATTKLVRFLEFDEARFRLFFEGSPIKRIGIERFLRNVLTAIGNSNDPSMAQTVRPFLGNESKMLRESAKWAALQLED